jgi:hypothetical protein
MESDLKSKQKNTERVAKRQWAPVEKKKQKKGNIIDAGRRHMI